MYRCKVERHSVSPGGVELLSFLIEFPRVVLAEVVTHRLNSDSWGDGVSPCERTATKEISKNSASSRAIPHARFVGKIRSDPYVPRFTVAGKGMQGAFSSDAGQTDALTAEWLAAREDMLGRAERMNALGAHKQDSNRLLESWAWVTQIVTSSRWDNFFALRCHPAAHPAFQKVARMMFLARRASTPEPLRYGQWHLPFTPVEEQRKFFWRPIYEGGGVKHVSELPDPIKFSAARCAWLSYENHDKDSSPEELLRTWNRLIVREEGDADPVHGSPVEHQATPLNPFTHPVHDYGSLESNLRGWIQARKLIPREACEKYDPSESEIESWGLAGADFWPEEAI